MIVAIMVHSGVCAPKPLQGAGSRDTARSEPDYHTHPSRNLRTSVGHATDGSVSLATTLDPTYLDFRRPRAGAPRTTSAGS
jgi:hypothetical protein